MTTIYRYPINEAINDIKLPIGAEILKVGVTVNETTQSEEISLWAKVDDTAPCIEERRFLIFGTGADMDSTVNFNARYIDTVQKRNRYAFHIFEVML